MTNQKITQNPNFINLTQDLMFKTFFSKDKRLLISLVQAFISQLKEKQIENITVKNQEQRKEKSQDQKQNQKQEQQKASLSLEDSAVYPKSPDGKKITLDFKAHLSTGENINIEMQAMHHAYFKERTLFYWKNIYGQDFKSGENYDVLKPAYSLIFADFRLFANSEDFLNSFSIRSDKPPYFVLTEHFGMTMVDLSLFSAVPREEDSDSKGKGSKPFVDMASAWCYFIKNSSSLTERDFKILAKMGKIFELAIRFLKELSMNDPIRALETDRAKEIADYYAYIHDATNKGIEKGKKEGRQEGLEEGMEKGHQEAQQQIALNLLKEKVDLPFIAKTTGLSIEEIKKLK